MGNQYIHMRQVTLAIKKYKICMLQKAAILASFLAICPNLQLSLEMIIQRKIKHFSRIKNCKTHVETLHKCVWVTYNSSEA